MIRFKTHSQAIHFPQFYQQSQTSTNRNSLGGAMLYLKEFANHTQLTT